MLEPEEDDSQVDLEPTNLLGLKDPSPRIREPSPTWDIELDLNSPEPEVPAKPLPTSGASTRKRPPSPVWDIELDLNDSDIENEPTK